MRSRDVCMAAMLLVSNHAHAQTRPVPQQVPIATGDVPVITIGELRFRDLDRNGRLTAFEDWRLSPERRAADLVSRMTLEEKAGATMHATLPAIGAERGTSSKGYNLALARPLVLDKHITSFITRLAVTPRVMAEQNNAIQAIAERGRFAIPVTVSTDPRHHFLYTLGQSAISIGFSRWPETLGFAALRDAALVRRFADIARHEYRATGIHQALSPQADLFTDPRWARGYGGFGSDPKLARDMVAAYVEGFQNGRDGIGPQSVLATAKHWVGYGATANGFDGHSYYGRMAKVDAASFKLHIEPFLGAFNANVGAIMPTYDIVEGASVRGKAVERVSAGFNKQILTDLLRGDHGFKGLVVSDWAITNDCTASCRNPTADAPQRSADLAMPWGVENLSRLQRFAKGMNAGIDQFGGVAEPDQIVAAVRRNLISPRRLDASVRRVMFVKFALGLFDDPFVDPASAERTINTPPIATESEHAQASAQVLLKDPQRLLPLRPGTRVFASGVDATEVRRAGLMPVDDPARAEVALVRAVTPYETLHPYHLIGSRQHEGRLDFRPGNPDLATVQRLSTTVPVIVSIFLDRPAVLGPMNDAAAVILGNFGVSDTALLAAVTGRIPPLGRLPFELPSSMAAVAAQDGALPDDSRDPLYRFGAGMPAARRP